jgi:hypothetical protein
MASIQPGRAAISKIGPRLETHAKTAIHTNQEAYLRPRRVLKFQPKRLDGAVSNIRDLRGCPHFLNELDGFALPKNERSTIWFPAGSQRFEMHSPVYADYLG